MREGEGAGQMSEKGIFARLGSAYATWPDVAGWRYAALQALWSLPLIGLAGRIGGFLAWRPEPGPAAWKLVAIAFMFPALAEESLFRVAFIKRTGARRTAAATLSLLLFVAWHPLQDRLYWLPWHRLAWDPFFLADIALLGLACTRIWLRTGSVWPCVALHWSAVALWKICFGAPLALPHF